MSGNYPATGRGQDLLELFDELCRKTPRPDAPPLPIVVLVDRDGVNGPAALDQVQQWCQRAEPYRLICVRIDLAPDDTRTTRELLKTLYSKLVNYGSHPQFGSLKFPRYQLGEWMTELTLLSTNAEEQLAEIRRLLCRRQDVEAVIRPFNEVTSVTHLVLNLLPWVNERLLRLALAWRGPLRRSIWTPAIDWYEDQEQRAGLTKITHIVRYVNQQAQEDHPAAVAEVDRRLVRAFLEDLRAAYDPARVRRATSRTTNCVVLLDGVDHGAGCDLLRLLAEERAAGHSLPDPLLVFAASRRPLPDETPERWLPRPAGDPAGPQERAATWLAAWRERFGLATGRLRGAAVYLNIDVSADRPRTLRRRRAAARQISVRLPARLPKRLGGRLPAAGHPPNQRSVVRTLTLREPLPTLEEAVDVRLQVPPAPPEKTPRPRVRIAGVTACALLAGYLVAYAGAAWEGCPDEPRVTDPAGVVRAWRTPPGFGMRRAPNGECIGVTDGSTPFSAATADVERLIAAENARVVAERRSVQPAYVTIVVMQMLSSPSGLGKSLASGRNELAGAYVAQREYNESALQTARPLLRLLVANSGGNSAWAHLTARQIVELARADRTVIAVTGLGQSRETTRQAISLLGAAGLPMVASTNSADTLAETKLYFRVAPRNRRQAAVAAGYAKQVRKARRAAVLVDPDDLYSANLAADFITSFTHDETGARDLARSYDRYEYHAARPAEVGREILDIVRRMCQAPPARRPDVIYYSGRSNEYPLLSEYLGTDCRDWTSYTIMGGDDLTNLPTPPDATFRLQPKPLIYTTAAPPGSQLAARGPERGAQFHAGFRQTFPRVEPNEHSVLAYDAVSVVTYAMSSAYKPYASREVRREDVLAELGKIDLEHPVQGASGTIKFMGGEPYDKAVFLLQLDTSGAPRWIGTCGRISSNPRDPGYCPPPE